MEASSNSRVNEDQFCADKKVVCTFPVPGNDFGAVCYHTKSNMPIDPEQLKVFFNSVSRHVHSEVIAAYNNEPIEAQN